jgi:hypothetical protein
MLPKIEEDLREASEEASELHLNLAFGNNSPKEQEDDCLMNLTPPAAVGMGLQVLPVMRIR